MKEEEVRTETLRGVTIIEILERICAPLGGLKSFQISCIDPSRADYVPTYWIEVSVWAVKEKPGILNIHRTYGYGVEGRVPQMAEAVAGIAEKIRADLAGEGG